MGIIDDFKNIFGLSKTRGRRRAETKSRPAGKKVSRISPAIRKTAGQAKRKKCILPEAVEQKEN